MPRTVQPDWMSILGPVSPARYTLVVMDAICAGSAEQTPGVAGQSGSTGNVSFPENGLESPALAGAICGICFAFSFFRRPSDEIFRYGVDRRDAVKAFHVAKRLPCDSRLVVSINVPAAALLPRAIP